MRKALHRLWQWVYHPSIRHDSLPRGKATLYRYPSPGNEVPNIAPADYKKPFSTSDYNIRYDQFSYVQSQQQVSNVITHRYGWAVPDKLVAFGLLKAEDIKNNSAIEKAKEQFQRIYRTSADRRMLQNDLELSEIDLNDKEGLREIFSKNLAGQIADQKLNNMGDKDQHHNRPDVHYMQSLDIYSDPSFQQVRIENEYLIQKIANLRAEEGIEVRKGQANFWKALDDSNSSQNIKKVQQKIGDEVPLNFELRDGKIQMEFDKDGNVIDLHRKV